MNHPVAAPRDGVLYILYDQRVSSENASEPFGLGRASLERLLHLEDPDQVGGELTGGGPLVLASHALAVVVPDEVEQRGPGDGARVDSLQHNGAEVEALGAVRTGIDVELLLVLVGERAGSRAARAGQKRALGRFAALLCALGTPRAAGA